MKAVVLHAVNDMRLDELPVPQPGAGEVLIKIKACGICGTDVHMWAGTNYEGTFPFIPGHEWMGEIVEVGPGVRKLKMGDRVTGEPFIGCGVGPVCHTGGAPHFCPDHRYFGFAPDTPGGMAEYHVSPEIPLFRLPEGFSDDEGALVEPVSVAYHAIWGRGGGVAPHDRVAVFGAGPIGLLAVQVAKAAGAQTIVVEPAPFRAQMACDVGADVVIDPRAENLVERVRDLTDGLGLSLIVECSGSEAGIASTVEVVAVDGRIVLTGQSFGLKPAVALGKTIWTHATIAGSCGAPHFFPKTIAYMARRLNDPTRIITHRFPLSEARAGFDLALKGTGSGKVMLHMD